MEPPLQDSDVPQFGQNAFICSLLVPHVGQKFTVTLVGCATATTVGGATEVDAITGSD